MCSSDLLNLMAAFQTIAIQDTNRTAAQEQLQLATDRYSIGSGSFLELYSDFDRITDDAAWERNRAPLSLEHAANVRMSSARPMRMAPRYISDWKDEMI